MASPAFNHSTLRETHYFKVPNEFAENQSAFIPAERALALIIFREASIERNGKRITDLNGTAHISDDQWRDWTGLQPRMLEMAVRGLKEKGLEVDGRGAKASYSWNWNRWHSAFKNRPDPSGYDPKRKERDAAAAAKRVHPDCATGCAKFREMQAANPELKQVTPLLVINFAQPVAQTAKKTKKEWPKTMDAMRAISLDAGWALLLRIIAVIASFGNVADGVLASAVRNAGKYQSARLAKYGPILLVKIIPNILATWKAKGLPLDKDPDSASPPAFSIGEKDLEQARKILQDVDNGADESRPSELRWSEADIEWARECLAVGKGTA